MAKQQQRKSKVVKKIEDDAFSVNKAITIRRSWVWALGAIGVFMSIYTFGNAWVSWEMPVPAFVHWVRGHVKQTVAPVQAKVDYATQIGLENNLQLLTGERRNIDRDKFDLEVKMRTVKDAAAVSIIQQRLNAIAEEAKETDRKIETTRDSISKLKAH